MKDSPQSNFSTVISWFAIIFFCSGVFLFYYFFRQVNAQLIETIPSDAAFLFHINDNETFLRTEKNIHNYITSLFWLDAYPGCQFFVDQLPGKYNQVLFSGHPTEESVSILFACKINERAFKQLIPKLQIDEKNCIKFERCKIYTYGTHLKRFVFTYHKGIFLASENITLLRKAISQLKNPRNLTTIKSFDSLFHIIEKNRKQNWLILNHKIFFSIFETNFNEETIIKLNQFASHVSWAAYQVRFSKLNMSFSGYLSVNDSYQSYFNNLVHKQLYYSSLSVQDEPIDYEKDDQLRQAKAQFPSHSELEIGIRAANTEYWGHFLSEKGMKNFSIAQMKLFALSIDSLNTKLKKSNGLIKY
jgi:hypothetical protein